MYSHYMNGPFSPLPQQVSHSSHEAHTCKTGNSEQPKKNDLLDDITGGLTKILGGITSQFCVANIDLGDVLLMLIILLLFLEGDNLELVITLGLMILLGLND